jgi:hypothetical protein
VLLHSRPMIVFDPKDPKFGIWEESGFEREHRIDELLLRHPEIVQRTLYGDDTILPLAGGTGNQFKNIDALFVRLSGEPAVVPQNLVRRETLAAMVKVTQRTELGPLRALPTVRQARIERGMRLGLAQCAQLTLTLTTCGTETLGL